MRCCVIIFLLTSILDSFVIAEDNKEKAKFYAEQASVFKHDKENYVKAIELYKKAIQLDPDNFQYHLFLAGTYIGMKKREKEAICEYQKAVKIDPNNWLVFSAHLGLARAYFNIEEYDKAIEEIKIYMEVLNSDKYEDSLRKKFYTSAYSFLEEIYRKRGDLSKAEEMTKKKEDYEKLAKVASEKFAEEFDKNITIRRDLTKKFLGSNIMDDLVWIFTPIVILLVLLFLVYTFQKRRRINRAS